MLLVLLGLPLNPRGAEIIPEKGRIVFFLGDSNTFAGRFIAYLEDYLRIDYPRAPSRVDQISACPVKPSLAFRSPTIPDPRPNVHDRLAAAGQDQAQCGRSLLRDERRHLLPVRR